VATKRARKQRKRPKFNPSELGNIKTYIQQVADTAIVPIPPVGGFNPDLVGTQCVYIAPGVGNSNSTMIALMGIPDLTQMAHDVYTTDPISTNNSAAGQFLPSTKFRVLNCNSKYTLINQSNSQICVDMFYIKCRRDIPNSWSFADLHTLLGDGFYQRGYGSSRGAANEGINLASLTPYDSTKFTSLFDIYKTEKHILNCGNTIRRTITNGLRYINWEHYEVPNGAGSGANQIYSHIKGEKCILFKITPNPVVNLGPSGQLYNSYSEPLVQLSSINHYNYQGVNSQQPKILKAPAIGFTGYIQPTLILAQNQDGHMQTDTFAGSNENGGKPQSFAGPSYNSTITNNPQ